MNIRDRQLTRATDEAIRQELCGGRPPSLVSVQKQVAQAFRDRPAGFPRFRVIPAEKGKPSDPAAYNSMFSDLHTDLELLNDEVFAQNRRMLGLADYYESEKLRLTRDLSRLSHRIDDLTERAAHRGESVSLADSFTDFQQVEFRADPARNLPATTALIDLERGEATLWQVTDPRALVDLTAGTVRTEISGTYQENRVDAPPESALNEHLNESWQQVITSSSADGLSLLLTVELPEPAVANLLTVWPQMPKPAAARLLLSADGQAWRPVPITGTSPLVWAFESQPVKAFKIEFTKSAPDLTAGAAYEYHFGAQRIRLKASAYLPQSTLVSRALPAHGLIRRVSLATDEVLPPNTAIRYYVAVDRQGQPLDWRELGPDRPLAFTPADWGEQRLSPPNPAVPYEFPSGGKLCPVGIVGKGYDAPGLEVRAGDFMWLVETWESATAPDRTPQAEDFAVLGAPTGLAYMRAEKPTLDVPTGYRRATLWVDVPAAHAGQLAVPAGEAVNCSYSIYLNGVPLTPSISNTYAYDFKPGLNQITVLAVNAPGSVSNPPPGKLLLRVPLPDMSVRVNAHRTPMRRVTAQELVAAGGVPVYDAFALVEGAEGLAVVVNYDPVAADIEGGVVRYLVRNAGGLRFMAVLTRSDSVGDIAPRLRSYRLRAELGPGA